jgi:protein-disulfide isomerase
MTTLVVDFRNSYFRKELMRSLLRSFLVLTLLSSALAQQKSPKVKDALPPVPSFSNRLPSEDTVNAFMKQMFGYDPSVTWKIAVIRPSEAEGLTEVLVVLSNSQGQQNSRLYVTTDGAHAVVGDIIPFGAHPFAPAQEALSKGIDGPSRGPADAPVTVVEFSDLQCPHCKEVQPTIEKLMSEEKNIRLVFQNFPLPGHDWAAKAAYYGDCIGRTSPDAFWKYVASVYGSQTDITASNADEKLTAIAVQSGASGPETSACAAKPETVARVQRSVALGAALDVSGTPTLFVNGRKIANVGGLPYEILKGLTEFAARNGN